MSFRLVPKSATLTDLERRNSVILRYFSEFRQLPGALRKSSRSLSHLLMSSCFSITRQTNNNVGNLVGWGRQGNSYGLGQKAMMEIERDVQMGCEQCMTEGDIMLMGKLWRGMEKGIKQFTTMYVILQHRNIPCFRTTLKMYSIINTFTKAILFGIPRKSIHQLLKKKFCLQTERQQNETVAGI